ncbi:MFS transporter (macronuclear) [Tetrahymena thermophila SB210]|uniref:MFS transporter n=1 Tax=Tetrahymena thermophila (strain SB210) TaxID=312017 RepID=I7LW70_TETTS|nr:MFS transporter [Tetrahymena thermophila SB210]EAS01074.2 MFS transporter [Tetrahymena thermophila SB210]|eukprot:XP_001021319.2 MFS transporter [Tetrahymena thermophila SB210]
MRTSFGPHQKKSLLDIEEEDQNQFRDYPYRWFLVFLFCLPNMMNGIGWITFSPISTQVEQAYDQSQFVITMTSMSYMFFYVLITFPSNFLLSKSLKYGIWLGSVLTILGGWVRIFINNSFWWAIFGQILGAIGQPFILNAPSKIAAVWFKPKERPIATAILALINTIGVGIGFLFPSFFVDDSYSDQTRDQVYQLMLWQAVTMTIAIVPCIIFFKEKPPTPPSHAAEAEKMSFKESFVVIFQNKDFIKLFFAFGCVLGNFNSIATLINFYLEQFGFSSDQTSYFGAMFIVSGLIGSGILSVVVERTSAYKKVMTITCLISIFTYGLQMGMLVLENFWLLMIAIFLMGFFTTPLIPISMDFACEITFPISEPFSSGLVLASGQLFGSILVTLIAKNTFFMLYKIIYFKRLFQVLRLFNLIQKMKCLFLMEQVQDCLLLGSFFICFQTKIQNVKKRN